MFFGDDLITFSKKDPLSILWFAGTLKGRRKLSKHQVLKCNLVEYKDLVKRNKKILHKLRLSGTLLLGLVVIYRRKTEYLINELRSVLAKSKIQRSENSSEMDTSSIDLSESSRVNIDLPTSDNPLASVLNECYYMDYLYDNNSFNANLKRMLDQSTSSNYGFVVDFSSSEESSPESDKNERDVMNSPEIAKISFEANIHEEIDFGDLEIAPSPRKEAEEMTIDLDEGGGDMDFDIIQTDNNDIQAMVSQINRDIVRSTEKKSLKRKRDLKNALVDKKTTLADTFIRDCINETSDITTRRPKIRSVRNVLNLNEKELNDFLTEPSCNSILDNDIIDFYKEQCLEPPTKRRKLENEEMFRTPEIERSAPPMEIDMDEGGGDMDLELPAADNFDFPDRSDETEVPQMKLDLPSIPHYAPDEFERFLGDIAVDEDLVKRTKIEKVTAKYKSFLESRLRDRIEDAASFQELVNPPNARIATMGFQRTLYLASKGLIEVTQDSPYGPIMLKM